MRRRAAGCCVSVAPHEVYTLANLVTERVCMHGRAWALALMSADYDGTTGLSIANRTTEAPAGLDGRHQHLGGAPFALRCCRREPAVMTELSCVGTRQGGRKAGRGSGEGWVHAASPAAPVASLVSKSRKRLA